MHTLTVVIAIAVYLIVMMLVGIFYSKKNKSSDDFYLGGRRLGPLITSMSAEASDMSSWLLMGLPGVALLAGLAEATWTAIGLGVGTYLNWLIVAKRIRNYSSHLNAITIPEFFSKRFHENKQVLNGISALMIIVFFVPYTASGFNACGTLFSTLFDVDYRVAMLISAVVIVFYTSVGGFLASAVTDFLQAIVMTAALAVVIVFGVHTAGGMGAVIENAKALPGYLGLTQTYDVATGTATPYSFLTILSTLAWGLGYFGMPHILLCFMAIKDPKKLKTSRRVGTVWVVISMAAAIFIGIVGYAVTQTGAIAEMTVSTESQRILIILSDLLAEHGTFFAILAGVILSGILASTMSTSDSQLLAAASSVSQNLVQEVFGCKLKEKTSMILARLTVIVIAIISAIWAWEEDSVFSIVSFAWAGFGAAFGPVVLFSLFWKRTNRWGALAGMVFGGGTVFLWKYALRPLGGLWDIYELLPAFIVGCIAIVTVSLLTPAPNAETVKDYEAVKAMK